MHGTEDEMMTESTRLQRTSLSVVSQDRGLTKGQEAYQKA